MKDYGKRDIKPYAPADLERAIGIAIITNLRALWHVSEGERYVGG
jgi:hypothetical protein